MADDVKRKIGEDRDVNRYGITLQDLDAAKRFATLALEDAIDHDAIDTGEDRDQRTRYEALSLAAVVSYARPFSNNKPNPEHHSATSIVPNRIERSLNAEQREFHKVLIDLRNNELAHSSACRARYSETTKKFDKEQRNYIRLWSGRSLAEPLIPHDIEKFLACVGKLEQAVKDALRERHEKFPDGHCTA